MAAINPPGFLQNAGATHTAEQFRNHLGLFVVGKQSSTSLIPRGGVNPALGNALQVTQSGSPAMSVVVKSGHATIPGSEGSKQGVYTVLNDADVTVSINASHATLHRIDRIVFKVEDQAYSGVTNTSSIVAVAGTPASSPVAPAAPNNSITLATVSIVANDTAITNGEITDTRFYMAAVGGVIQCLSTGRPSANTITDGQIIYETDTDKYYNTHNAGTSWSLLPGQVVARGHRSTDPGGITTETGVLRIDNVVLKNGRIYQFFGMQRAYSSSGTDTYASKIRVNTAGVATTSSTQIGAGEQQSHRSVVLTGLYAPGADVTASFLLSFNRASGSGTFNANGDSSTVGLQLYIIECGTDPTDTGVDV